MSGERPAKGLGRGLSALLGDAEAAAGSAGQPDDRKDGVREIEIGRIRPNPEQPRTNFDDAALAQLAQSIADRGLLQPILVRPTDIGFQIIAGERRWRAAQRAGLHDVPVVVLDVSDGEALELAIIEIVQRADLNP
ncbi:MAG: ParB/RepB/Spo0J family partition protein, partial [Sphingomicrobium sp.]